MPLARDARMLRPPRKVSPCVRRITLAALFSVELSSVRSRSPAARRRVTRPRTRAAWSMRAMRAMLPQTAPIRITPRATARLPSVLFRLRICGPNIGSIRSASTSRNRVSSGSSRRRSAAKNRPRIASASPARRRSRSASASTFGTRARSRRISRRRCLTQGSRSRRAKRRGGACKRGTRTASLRRGATWRRGSSASSRRAIGARSGSRRRRRRSIRTGSIGFGLRRGRRWLPLQERASFAALSRSRRGESRKRRSRSRPTIRTISTSTAFARPWGRPGRASPR